MDFSVFVRLWGGLDVVYIVWRIVKDASESKVPFLGFLAESLNVVTGFGLTSISILTSVMVVITMSMILSGPLMLVLNRIGVYVSLVQFPFRILLLMPPTFFFIYSVKDYLPSLLLITVILTFEIIKAVTEIIWLRKSK